MHCFLTTTLVIHAPFLLPSFIRREEKRGKNNNAFLLDLAIAIAIVRPRVKKSDIVKLKYP